MTTIHQLLDQKGRDTWSTHPDATVLEAAAKMAEKNIGSLIVMDGGTFLGIITERHVARNTATMAPNSPVALVRDVMETRVLVARPEHSVEQCMALMTERRVAHLPVLERNELVGIVSIGDLVKSKISDQTFTIDQLEHFIHGHR